MLLSFVRQLGPLDSVSRRHLALWGGRILFVAGEDDVFARPRIYMHEMMMTMILMRSTNHSCRCRRVMHSAAHEAHLFLATRGNY